MVNRTHHIELLSKLKVVTFCEQCRYIWWILLTDLNAHIVVCPAEGRERLRRSAGNTKKRKTCSQQKVTRIKRFWSKHFRPRNKTIFTAYDRSLCEKIKPFFCKYILFLCLKAFTSQVCLYVNAFLLGTSLANLFAPSGWRVLVNALLPGTQRCLCNAI